MCVSQVLLREIDPARLVTMSADELASKELAEWREREEKKVRAPPLSGRTNQYTGAPSRPAAYITRYSARSSFYQPGVVVSSSGDGLVFIPYSIALS